MNDKKQLVDQSDMANVAMAAAVMKYLYDVGAQPEDLELEVEEGIHQLQTACYHLAEEIGWQKITKESE